MQRGPEWSIDGARGVPHKHSCECSRRMRTPGQPSLAQTGMVMKMSLPVLKWMLWTVVSHRTGERRDFPSACHPQPSSSFPNLPKGDLGWRLARGCRTGGPHRPPRGEDGGCTGLVVVGRPAPAWSDGAGGLLPRAGRARSPRRLGAWAEVGPCRSQSRAT
jgi:hypothetical protein